MTYKRIRRRTRAFYLKSSCGFGANEVQVKGTATQIVERYEIMAREAEKIGDYSLYHLYMNHAEHYGKETQ